MFDDFKHLKTDESVKSLLRFFSQHKTFTVLRIYEKGKAKVSVTYVNMEVSSYKKTNNKK